jgi:hypothetical protein
MLLWPGSCFYRDTTTRFVSRAPCMNQLIDNDFQPVEQVIAGRKSQDFFVWMLAISLALHVISSVILLAPHQNSFTMPTVSYLDLKNISLDEQVKVTPHDPVPPEPLAEEPRKVPDTPFLSGGRKVRPGYKKILGRGQGRSGRPAGKVVQPRSKQRVLQQHRVGRNSAGKHPGLLFHDAAGDQREVVA